MLEDLQHRLPKETRVKPTSEKTFLTFFDESEREDYNESLHEHDVVTTETRDSGLPGIVARETHDQVLGVIGGLENCRRDLVCLRPNEHVNKIVVGAWLTMVHNAKNPTGDVNDCFLVEPTWLQEMWIFNIQLRGVDSLKETGEPALQVVVQCSINGSHWSLILCVAPTRTVRVFDSLRDDKQYEYADFVVKILNAMYAIQDDDFKASVRKTKWFVERNHNKTPRLNNPNDSGIFVCWLAEKLLGDESPGLINSGVIKAKRAHILSCIVSGSIET
ncbi:hypothetical protein AC1031_005481 [Aphanomyces cochlioides]|nr:hypothetical protein AC1031_005481 [Aphanomyces cochlioides]